MIELLPKLRDKKPLVFMIAEEPDILNLAKKFLKLGDYDAIVIKNTKEALKIINERYKEISMVLLDVMLPYRGA